MSVIANDQDQPPLEAAVILTVTVLRNVYSPQFLTTTYTAVIGEYTPVNTVVVGVNATDANPPTV